MLHSAARQLQSHDDDGVIAGLHAPRKRLPWRLLHEARGDELFERITALDDYYPAHIERELLERHLPQIAHQVGAGPRVVAPVSCVASTRTLLRGLERPSSIALVDDLQEPLHRAAAQLRAELPRTEVMAVPADYTQPFDLPAPQHEWLRTLLAFPGSLIGNLEPAEARAFLAMLGRIAGSDRLLLLGADGTRDPSALERAYDDDAGVIAAFAKGILTRLDRTHGATFDIDAFDYRAVWNGAASRVELQLVSTRRQLVRVAGEVITFAPGEPIVVAHSYKHTPDAMSALLATAGWRARQAFTSSHRPYRLWLCEPLAPLR